MRRPLAGGPSKRAAAIALLAICLACPAANSANAPSAFNRPTDVQAITELERTIMQDPDAAQRVADYAPDAILISDIPPGWAEGRASIAPVLAPPRRHDRSAALPTS